VNTSARAPSAERPPFITIALASAVALGYEILLIRLFSVIQWHHFAYMIISLALLGYGASGTFLAVTQARLLRHYPRALSVNLTLFAATLLPCFLLAQSIQFSPEEMLWKWQEILHLAGIYLLLSLPFFLVANSIALTLARYRRAVTRVYAADLAGAGTGSLVMLLLLYVLPPLQALTALCAAGAACLVLAAFELRLEQRLVVSAGALLLAGLAIALGVNSKMVLSPYKALSQELRVKGAQLVDQQYSPLGLIDVVDNALIPPRFAPGMSLNSPAGPPRQLGLYIDGNSAGAITRDTGKRETLRFLDQLTSALPYHLQRRDPVLVVGAGGGMVVLQAVYEQAGQVDVLEINPQITGLLRGKYAAFTGGLYRHPGVQVYTAEARGFLSARQTRYGLIQLWLQDSAGASTAGLYALSENYLYTTQALREYLDHLRPGGYLAISLWIKLPPRDTLKLFVTAIDALRAAGAANPGRRLILIRGWQTSTLLIKNGDFRDEEIRATQAFCRTRSFDLAWYPGISAGEANRYNRLKEPYFYAGARALLGPDRQTFLDDYKFNLQPATDDRPYFHNFFKWSTLGEILELRGQGGLPLLETGYPVIVATLIQAALLSVVLILLPLLLARRRAAAAPAAAKRLHVLVYFGAIGLAFLFLEIALIQKFMRFLHHPVFTAAVILASFLVFAGLGSFRSRHYGLQNRQHAGVVRAVAGIVLTGVAYLFALDPLFGLLAAWPAAARMFVSSLLIAPIAFFMGAPFPLAFSRLGQQAGDLLPLAWGVNGCASVLSAVLATLLAIHFGFAVVVVMALVLYAVSAAVFPGGPA